MCYVLFLVISLGSRGCSGESCDVALLMRILNENTACISHNENAIRFTHKNGQENIETHSMSFPEYDQVKALIGLYVDGLRLGKADMLKKAFHPRAYVMGHGEKLGFKGHFEASKFIQILLDNPALAGPTYSAKIQSMQITNDAGVVVLEEVDFHNCNFINYLSVSKLEGQWYITNKTYTCINTA